MADVADIGYGYGNWYLTLIYVLVFSLFVAFIPFRKRISQLPSSVYIAFVVALYAEMYGFPLTIYILSWAFGYQNPLTHLSGHLLANIVGEDLFFALLHPLSVLMISAGVLLVVFGWRSTHSSQNQLRTTGLYAHVRHPQYLGFLTMTLGMIVQWATVPTLVMWPILVALYYRLARQEERELHAKFGEKFLEYKKGVPMMLPLPKPNWRGKSTGQSRKGTDASGVAFG